jgi:hypothetical protein
MEKREMEEWIHGLDVLYGAGWGLLRCGYYYSRVYILIRLVLTYPSLSPCLLIWLSAFRRGYTLEFRKAQCIFT